MLFNSLLAYAAFPFVGKCSNLIELRSKPLPLEIAWIHSALYSLDRGFDDAKLRRFLAHSKLFRSFFIKSNGQETWFWTKRGKGLKICPNDDDLFVAVQLYIMCHLILLSKPWADDGRVLLRRQILRRFGRIISFWVIIWREKGRTVLNESERIWTNRKTGRRFWTRRTIKRTQQTTPLWNNNDLCSTKLENIPYICID